MGLMAKRVAVMQITNRLIDKDKARNVFLICVHAGSGFWASFYHIAVVA